VQNEKQAPEFIDILLWIIKAVLKRWKGIAFAAFVAGAVSSIIVVFVVDEEFESAATISPPASGGSMKSMLGNLGDLSGMLGISMPEDGDGDVLSTLLESNDLQERIISQFKLDSVYKFTANKHFYKADLLKTFRKNFEVSSDPETSYLTITMRDNDPIRAQKIVEYSVAILDTMYEQIQTRKGGRLRQFYETRLTYNQHLLDSLENAMVAFQKKNHISDPKLQLEASIKNLGSLEAQKETAGLQLQNEVLTHGSETSEAEKLKQQYNLIVSTVQRLRDQGGISGAQVSVQKIPELARQYEDLYEAIFIQQAVHQYLRQQYEQALLKEANNVQQFEILEKPWTNDKRVSPPRRAIVSSMMLFVIILGVLYSVFMEMYFEDKQRGGKRSAMVREIGSLLPWRKRVA